MKICVIGSSHTASLKEGWERMSALHPDVELVFFSSLGRTMRTLRVRDGTLFSIDPKVARRLAVTSGGKEVIRPEDYDAFLIYGVDLRVPRVERGISSAVFQAVVDNVLASSPTTFIAERLRRITGKTIWIAPTPLETSLEPPEPDRTYRSYDSVISALQSAIPVAEARLLGQPPATICDDFKTLLEFGNWATRRRTEPGAPHARPAQDTGVQGEFRHMNADFGALWLEANLPVILREAGRD